jgi:hypothetical protein
MRTDEALKFMTDELNRNAPPRWLRYKPACDYVGLKPGTMAKKLTEGVGPKFYRAPGSRNKIFKVDDLDAWIENAPERPLTQAENMRLEKLQAGAARVRERQRARRRPEIGDSGEAA